MKMVTRPEKVQSILWFHESMSLITVQRQFRGQYGRQPLCALIPSNNGTISSELCTGNFADLKRSR